ncbi:antibiotic biosynthesis monooxygenase family protein [Formosa sp. S-31]|uniref:antibiotic biosynthesis monooxygenase family protein n=1 Tax=Formosa sp. S-31 TaxID=2790949 RepID=UPI003EBA3BD3
MCKPNYYAVIFTSKLKTSHPEYSKMAELMGTLAKKQPGFLGMDSARDGIGITVSYWEDLESIKLWKAQTEHIKAQKQGKNDWYSYYNVKICKVEREYEFRNEEDALL